MLGSQPNENKTRMIWEKGAVVEKKKGSKIGARCLSPAPERFFTSTLYDTLNNYSSSPNGRPKAERAIDSKPTRARGKIVLVKSRIQCVYSVYVLCWSSLL